MTEIKIDKNTLPKNEERIKFQTEDLEWHEGEFIEGDDLFLINSEDFHNKWSVIQWEKL